MRSRSGFTLVEVMISIALALLLMLAISQIFGLAQQTTGGGNAIISAVEGDRAMMSALTDDCRSIVDGPNTPGFVIASTPIATWRNAVDQKQSTTNDVGQLNPSDPSQQPTQLYFTQINERIHRADRFCFFARNKFVRQTGDITITSPTTSSEAFIWMGHMALPNNRLFQSGEWTAATPAGGRSGNSLDWANPGQPTNNDNNLYASSWVLGREAILLLPKATGETEFGPPDGQIFNPLSFFDSKAPNLITICCSRYDLAQTSVDQYRQYLASLTKFKYKGIIWWQNLIGYNNGSLLDNRYGCNPFPLKPGPTNAGTPGYMSAMAAQTYPIMIRGCSQFIVEFAGDFVSQDPTTGQVTSSVIPDGQIDFTVDPKTGAHKIRWYGFPRDPEDEGQIGVVASRPSTFTIGGQPVSTVYAVQYGVCPLIDTLKQDSTGWNTLLNTMNNSKTSWELPEQWPASPPASPPPADYSKMFMPVHSPNPNSAPSGMPSLSYVAAWGVDTIPNFPQPKMIRITFGIDDPDGHLSTTQMYEYVFTLP